MHLIKCIDGVSEEWSGKVEIIHNNILTSKNINSRERRKFYIVFKAKDTIDRRSIEVSFSTIDVYRKIWNPSRKFSCESWCLISNKSFNEIRIRISGLGSVRVILPKICKEKSRNYPHFLPEILISIFVLSSFDNMTSTNPAFDFLPNKLLRVIIFQRNIIGKFLAE